MGRIAAEGSDRFYATSDNPRSEDPDAIIDAMVADIPQSLNHRVVRETDRARAIERSIHSADPQDIVLLAGKGHETYQVLATETIAFDDREHAQRALSRRSRP
jgi:UDP-N-acetylmuramyl tripeptide synthase